MDMIRVWEVAIEEGQPQWFPDIDSALSYLRAELIAGHTGTYMESRLVTPEEYDQHDSPKETA